MPYSRHPQSLHALLDWWDKNNVAWYFFFLGGGWGGGMGDFVCVRIFSQTSGDSIFYHTACSIIHHEKYIFFSEGCFFFGGGGGHVFPSISWYHQNPPSPPPPQNSNGRPLIRVIAVEFVRSIKTRHRFNGHVKCTVRVSTLCCEDIYCRYGIQKSNDVVPPMIYQHL